MADIYRADDSVLGRSVAVKVLAEAFATDESSRRRFAREARAAARVSGDSNIVTIYDIGETDERPYIVMEYIAGPSLEQRLAEEARPSRSDSLRWLEQAARALDHAHANGVVHRDVKPGNLLLDEAGNVHVADFGIASAAWLPSLTVDGTVLGTAGYLSPEHAAGRRASPASDRYALAVVAYELLTGTRPFARESPTAEAAAHVSEPVPSVRDAGLLVELDDVFRRALAKRPEERYPTGVAFVADLRAAFDGAPNRTRTYPVPARRAPRWPLLAAGAGAAVVVGVLLAVLLPGGSPAPRTAARTNTSTPTHAPAAHAAAADPHSLNDRAWSLMQQGRYAAALPLLQRAVPTLRGAGPADPAEGYANYNLGFTLLQLGRCSDALPYLERAQTLEPQRSEVQSALADVQECLAPPPQKAEKHGHGRGKRKGHD